MWNLLVILNNTIQWEILHSFCLFDEFHLKFFRCYADFINCVFCGTSFCSPFLPISKFHGGTASSLRVSGQEKPYLSILRFWDSFISYVYCKDILSIIERTVVLNLAVWIEHSVSLIRQWSIWTYQLLKFSSKSRLLGLWFTMTFLNCFQALIRVLTMLLGHRCELAFFSVLLTKIFCCMKDFSLVFDLCALQACQCLWLSSHLVKWNSHFAFLPANIHALQRLSQRLLMRGMAQCDL